MASAKTTKKEKVPHQKYLTPLNIEPKKIGDYEIQQIIEPPNTKMMLNSGRTKLFGKQEGMFSISFPIKTKWHKLLHNNDTLMSDIPIEHRQMLECLRPIKSGKVLIGGLGVGLALNILQRRRAIKEIVVVEISHEVISLVSSSVKTPKHKLTLSIVNKNLLEFLKETEESFDWAFYDIWSSDGEGTFFNTVCPLFNLSKGKVKNPPINWNEDVMRGQLLWSLRSKLMFLKLDNGIPNPLLWKYLPEDGPGAIYHNWSVPFFQWWKEKGSKLPEDAMLSQANFYSQIYGVWKWQELWNEFK